MRTFCDWLKENDTEVYEGLAAEGILNKLMAGPLMAMTMMGGPTAVASKFGQDVPKHIQQQSSDNDAIEHKERLRAEKRLRDQQRSKAAKGIMPVMAMKKCKR